MVGVKNKDRKRPMRRKQHNYEQRQKKLKEIDRLVRKGKTLNEAIEQVDITRPSYLRWQAEPKKAKRPRRKAAALVITDKRDFAGNLQAADPLDGNADDVRVPSRDDVLSTAERERKLAEENETLRRMLVDSELKRTRLNDEYQKLKLGFYHQLGEACLQQMRQK
jgi:hypothetical protein